MGKETENPTVVAVPQTKGKEPSPAVWLTLLAVIAFPASVLSATPLIIMTTKGFNKLNSLYLSVALAVVSVFIYAISLNPLEGYKDVFLSVIQSAGFIEADTQLSPNYALFIFSGMTVGALLASVFAFAWRNKHKNDEEWQESHLENKDAVKKYLHLGLDKKAEKDNKRVIERIAVGDWFGSEEVGLGYVLDSIKPGQKIEPVGLPDLVGGSVNHSLILGSSGRGKSVSIARQAFDAIKKGDPVLVVDAKGDGDLAAKLGAYAEEFGRPFYHFTIPLSTSAPYVGLSSWGRAFYDPAGLSAGNHTRRRDFMMNARDWTGAPAVYSDKTRDWLSRALWVDNVVAECNGGRPLKTVPQATFSRIADFMSPISTRHYLREAALEFGVDAINDALGTTTYTAMMKELDEYADMKDQTGESARMSHAAWLRTFMSSITGPYLRDTGDDRTIDIARIVDEQAVCVFDLATDQYKEEAPAIARLVVADLLSYISSVGKADGLRLRVFLDEFAAVGGEDSANVLARARSAGVSFTLSTQTLSDLRDVSDAFEGQVLTNSLNILVHNASTWDEAERLAGMTGQVEQQRVTRSSRINEVDGVRTKNISMEKRYRIEPTEFMEMGVGELIKISQVERSDGKAVKVGVIMPPKIEGTVYTVDGNSPKELIEEFDSGEYSVVEEPFTDEEVKKPETSASAGAAPAGGTSISPFTESEDNDASIVEVTEIVDVPSEVLMEDPLTFVREPEDERRQRILKLANSNESIFNPSSAAPEVTPETVEKEPVALLETFEEVVRTQRPVRRRIVE